MQVFSQPEQLQCHYQLDSAEKTVLTHFTIYHLPNLTTASAKRKVRMAATTSKIMMIDMMPANWREREIPHHYNIHTNIQLVHAHAHTHTQVYNYPSLHLKSRSSNKHHHS